MALDGAFLSKIKQEIIENCVGARVEKVYQPSKEEIIITMRGKNLGGKLLLSARANSARVNFTNSSPENPKTPPMFCMLLRKKLASARLNSVTQPELERVLILEFDSVTELGDKVIVKLVVEIMGRYSNIIIVDQNDKIVDSIKRVDAQMSSERLVLPNVTYKLPPQQDKLNIVTTNEDEIVKRVIAQKPMALSKALLAVLQGISPIICREIMSKVCHGGSVINNELTSEQQDRLSFFIKQLKEEVISGGKPVFVWDENKKPIDFTFTNISQYGTLATTKQYDSYSQLLDEFFSSRDASERMKVKSQDLLKLLANLSDKLSRKINTQKIELEECSDREKFRVYADLVNANLYRIEKGSEIAQLENYFDENMSLIEIKLDPSLTPAQNAQKYYKQYRKLQTAQEILKEQITVAIDELQYVDSIFDSLTRCTTERELGEIREELKLQGYVKKSSGKAKKEVALPPKNYITTDGFTVLVGRNNYQNDKLTLKIASKKDIWFHTKNIPGTHVILLTENKEPSEQAIYECALLAAFNSKGANSSSVPVDYTIVKNIHKPQGAKPGKVIYDSYKTLYVTPNQEEVLKEQTKK